MFTVDPSTRPQSEQEIVEPVPGPAKNPSALRLHDSTLDEERRELLEAIHQALEGAPCLPETLAAAQFLLHHLTARPVVR